jgi:tetratricopeptide (TPR) repeat protein
VRQNREHPHRRNLPTGLLFLTVCIGLAGCTRPVRVTVPEPDIARSNEAAKDGDIAFGRKDYYAALIKYLESVRYNPGNGFVYNRLGITYSQLKYYDDAAAAFLKSIALNPKYPFSYNNLGSVYFAQKNMKQAERYFKKAISLREDEASFHMNMGSLHLEKKRPQKAMVEWRRALAIDPKVLTRNISVSLAGDVEAMAERQYYIARLMASTGEVESAIEHLKQAITNGFSDIDKIKSEPDFDRIKADPRFIDFLENAAVMVKLRLKVGLPEEPAK